MFLEPWRQDLRLAGYGLLRARAFTTTAVLTLAVGMAASTAMFALIEGVLLRPLPVPEQDRQRRYGGSRDVLGRRLLLSERPFVIVGVMPPDLECPYGVEGWLTLAVQVTRLFRRPHAHGLIAIIPHSRRGLVSLSGRRTMTTAIKLREVASPSVFATAA